MQGAMSALEAHGAACGTLKEPWWNRNGLPRHPIDTANANYLVLSN